MAAEVFKIVKPDGTVVYSDRPSDGSKKMDDLPMNTVIHNTKPATVEPQEDTEKPPVNETKTFPGYSALSILKPVDDAVVRNNAGNVTVLLELTPVLQEELGHTFNLFYDGKLLLTEQAQPQLNLQGLDRGTHQVYVEVVDEKGVQLLRSKTSTFHLKRHFAR